MDLEIALCGDIMMAAEVDRNIGGATVTDWLRGVSSAWSDADLVIGNLECPCVHSAQAVNGRIPEIIFRAPASRLVELANAGFTAVTLANNHILNCGPLGLSETIQGLRKAGVYHAGAGMNLEEALQPAYIPVHGMVVGLVAFAYSPVATNTEAGVTPNERKIMRRVLASARKHADVVVASLHDGLEYSDAPPSEIRARYEFIAENGADIVFGHHPHVLQGVEWHGNIPIAYSLGDFLFHNSLPHVSERNFARIAMGRLAPGEVARDPDKFSRGAILTVRLREGRKSLQWHPFRQDPELRPYLSDGVQKCDDLRRLEDLTKLLGDETDPRHKLADEVWTTQHWRSLDRLSFASVAKLAMNPKIRYFPKSVRWLVRKFKKNMKQLANS